MAETKVLEREYIIPLRRVWLKAPEYERGRKAIKAIKEFIAKHMKVTDRDLKKVKLDVFLNNEIWFRGKANPPAKVKVKATKLNDIVKVEFVETPQHVKFIKLKLDKFHKKQEKSEKKEEKSLDKKEIKTEDVQEKIEEKQKEQSVAELHVKEAKLDAKAKKHTTAKKEESYHRMALKK